MSADLFLTDDDLVAYALHLLPPAEVETVTLRLQSSVADQQRLAAIQLSLGLFCESVVPDAEPPARSLARLMSSIDTERHASAGPERTAASVRTARAPIRWSLAALLPWTGWAVAAALLLLVVGHYAPSVTRLSSQITTASSTASQADQAAKRVLSENAALKAMLAERTQQQAAAQSHATDAEKQATALRAKAEAALAEAAIQGGKASELASAAQQISHERDALKGQLNLQAEQSAQISAQSAEAQRVLAALRDPAAVRVTLTVPKNKPAPTGRGAYLASSGALVFIGSNLPTLQSGKVYELWLMPTDGSAPLPAGTFVPDASGNATLVNPSYRQNVAAKGFAVTVEKQGGSLTPTLPIVLVGL